MIDITDPRTLLTLKAALHRALNSLDQEIATVDYGLVLTPSQRSTKLALLRQSRSEMLAIYGQILLLTVDHDPRL